MFQIIFMVLTVSISSNTQNIPVLSIGIEVNQRHQYRVSFFASDFEEELLYDTASFKPASVGLAPFSAKVYVKNESGQSIGCGNSEGYSSAYMSSTLAIDKGEMTSLPSGERIYSPWYEIEDLMRGFKQCATDGGKIREWKSFKIVFNVELSQMQLSVESDWYNFDSDLLKRLR